METPARATCELQGYAYDAKMRGARMAREFWNDPAYADRLEREAAQLRERFNRDFWIEDEGYYALALAERRYNPVGYHIGTVWPFDNSIIAWGLWRYVFREEAGRIAEGMITASADGVRTRAGHRRGGRIGGWSGGRAGPDR